VLPFKIERAPSMWPPRSRQPAVIDDIRLLSGWSGGNPGAVEELLEKIAACYQMTVEQMIENLSPERTPRSRARTCTTSR